MATRMMTTGGEMPPLPAGAPQPIRVTSAPAASSPAQSANRSPVQIMNWQGRLSQGDTSAQTRTVQDNETVNHQLNNLIRDDSQYIRQARDNAMDLASSKGMMFSTTAAGNAQRAAIDAALPIAQQDATTYGRTASENMAAVNADRLADQQMFGNLLGQEVGIRANLDEAHVNRGWQSGENKLNRQHQTSERIGSQNWQSGENKLGRQHTTSERVASQNWQTGERLSTQQWQTKERELTQNWQGSQNDIQRLHELNMQRTSQVHDSAMRQLDRNHALTMQERQQLQERFTEFNRAMVQHNMNLSQTLSAIYSNPNLTAQQQAAAAANARAVHDSLYQSYASSMSGGLPPIFWEPYEMQTQPASRQGPRTGGNNPPSVIGGGGYNGGGGNNPVGPPGNPGLGGRGGGTLIDRRML